MLAIVHFETLLDRILKGFIRMQIKVLLTLFKSVYQFDNALIVSQMLIIDKTLS